MSDPNSLRAAKVALSRFVKDVPETKRRSHKAMCVNWLAWGLMELLDQYVGSPWKDWVERHTGVSRGDRAGLIKKIQAAMDELEVVVGRDALADARAAVDRFVPILGG
jgi:hypothetical protein